MDLKRHFYPETEFGGFSDVDGTVAFYSRVNSLLKPESVVLDIGCGRGTYRSDPVTYRLDLRILKDKCARVTGIDVDPEAQENPFIDDFRLIKEDHWPVETGSVDLCINDYVLEHIKNPTSFFKESNRVLKTGGYLCIRTSNASSYFGFLTRIMPESIHIPLLKKVKEKQNEEDKFPVLFECNTVKKIQQQLILNGFKGIVYGYDAEPGYLSFSKSFYWLGVMHQKFAPRNLKVGIFVFARKI